jgi:hypothetical protein
MHEQSSNDGVPARQPNTSTADACVGVKVVRTTPRAANEAASRV